MNYVWAEKQGIAIFFSSSTSSIPKSWNRGTSSFLVQDIFSERLMLYMLIFLIYYLKHPHNYEAWRNDDVNVENDAF